MQNPECTEEEKRHEGPFLQQELQGVSGSCTDGPLQGGGGGELSQVTNSFENEFLTKNIAPPELKQEHSVASSQVASCLMKGTKCFLLTNCEVEVDLHEFQKLFFKDVREIRCKVDEVFAP